MVTFYYIFSGFWFGDDANLNFIRCTGSWSVVVASRHIYIRARFMSIFPRGHTHSLEREFEREGCMFHPRHAGYRQTVGYAHKALPFLLPIGGCAWESDRDLSVGYFLLQILQSLKSRDFSPSKQNLLFFSFVMWENRQKPQITHTQNIRSRHPRSHVSLTLLLRCCAEPRPFTTIPSRLSRKQECAVLKEVRGPFTTTTALRRKLTFWFNPK